MLVLLPPSETKRDGGIAGTRLDLATLSFPELTRARRATIAGTRKLARNLNTMAAVLRVGPSLRSELMRNRELGVSPTMPALERYTGVLYDALDVPTLSPAARRFAIETVAIHSPLFGLVGAGDPIPAYRLSHDSRLPGVSLKSTWRTPISTTLDSRGGLIIDLRSEAYVDLGPVSPAVDSVYFRLVSRGPDGTVRALNHFNKKGKGAFTRALLEAGIVHESVDDLLRWAVAGGFDVSRSHDGEVDLVV